MFHRFRFIYSKQFRRLEPIWIFISQYMVYDLIAEARNYSMVFLLSLPVYSGSLKRIDYP